MSTWAGIELGGFSIEEWQNTYHKWVFSELDRVREVGEQYEFIGYRLSADKLKRRLELRGINRDSVELEFKEYKAHWIDNIQKFVTEIEGIDQGTFSIYSKYLDVLKGCSLDSWIKLIPIAKNWSPGSHEDIEMSLSDVEKNQLEFMLSDYDEHPYYSCGDFHFPCCSSEIFTWVILQIVDSNSVCELDISGLVSSGWVDDFGDIAEHQAGRTKFYEGAKQEVVDIVGLCGTDINNAVLQRLSYSGLITILEAYLSDIAKRQVLNKESIKRRFVEKFKPFYSREKSICVSKIFKTLEQLDESIRECIDNLSFHNVETINSFYSSVLLIEIPEDIKRELSKAVDIRHDIIHRAGKTTRGEPIEICNHTVKEVSDLIIKILEFIDNQIVDGLLEH
jgi:hypothetical protein